MYGPKPWGFVHKGVVHKTKTVQYRVNERLKVLDKKFIAMCRLGTPDLPEGDPGVDDSNTVTCLGCVASMED